MESCHSGPHGRCYIIGVILDFTSYELRFKKLFVSLGGHFGRDKTYEKIASHFYWSVTMLHRVTFANEPMMANLSRQHLLFTPSRLNQKCGGRYVFIDRVITVNIHVPCGLTVHPTNVLLVSSICLPTCRLELIRLGRCLKHHGAINTL